MGAKLSTSLATSLSTSLSTGLAGGEVNIPALASVRYRHIGGAGITLGTPPAITDWADQGAGGIDLEDITAGDPTIDVAALNGKDVVAFDGTNDHHAEAAAATPTEFDDGNDFSVFAIVYPTNFDTNRLRIASAGDAAATNYFNMWLTTSGEIGFTRTSASTAVSAATLDAAAWNVVSVRWDDSEGDVTIRINGVDEVIAYANSPSTSHTAYAIGGRSDTGANVLLGSIAEVVTYDTFLSDADADLWDAYATAEYAL